MTDNPLSFCMITTFYPPYHFGGEAMYLYRLSNELARQGHRVTVVHCLNSYNLLSSAGARGAFPHHENVTVRTLKSRLGGLSPLVTYLSGKPGLKARELRRLFEEDHFDVIHFHIVSLVGGPGILSYGDAIKLYTTHEYWLVCPMHDLWKYNKELCEETDCFRCSLTFRRPPQLWRYSGLLERELDNVDLFLAPSHATIAEHERRGFTRPMRRLPHFLPLAEASGAGPEAPELPTSRPYFLYVGRLAKVKGAHTLIDAFRHYDKADLVIAGDGNEAAALRAGAADLPHVHFLGHVHPDELGSLYAGAVAVVVPTVVYETFGFVALEALANGTPVVVRHLGALPEIVEESGAGFTYRTEAELIEALEAIRTNPDLRRELGERGRAAHVERWSEGPHLAQYFAAIEEARERRRDRLQEPSNGTAVAIPEKVQSR
jgi:glycosyltransferase involved in cell wall biosynthesis